MSDEPTDAMSEPHDHAAAAGSPGASGPGQVGYEGEAMVGDEGAVAGAESFDDPFGRPDSVPGQGVESAADERDP